MILYDRNRWFNAVFSWRGTALRRAKWRVLSMIVYAGIIQVAYEIGVSLGGVKFKNFFGLDPGQHAVLGALLGFLIVFRMNASNNRFWEGRTCWGQIINACRNLVRVGVARCRCSRDDLCVSFRKTGHLEDRSRTGLVGPPL